MDALFWSGGVPTAAITAAQQDVALAFLDLSVQLLVHSAAELIPQSSLGVQFLSAESLINAAGVPLHPAAADAYRALHG